MLKERLKELRRREGITQTELARALQVSVGAVGNWESGKRSPDIHMLNRIADGFHVSVDYLTGRISSPHEHGKEREVHPLPRTYRVPLLGDIACGDPILAAEQAEEMVAVPLDITADFCLRCRGDSMIGARILEGDLVYVRRQETVDDGQIAAVLIGQEATLKRVYRGGRNLILQAENPAYKPIILTPDTGEEIRILGLAVAFVSRLR
ncbi:MAG: helix-turn-helix domain-containing protein [Clostridia bacterium]|nr:helix-turn-helix domain-containing protein [Clostridia bacterium]